MDAVGIPSNRRSGAFRMVRAVGGKIWGMAKRLEDAAYDPTVRAVAASAAVAAGGVITATAVRQRIADRRRRDSRRYRLRGDEPAADGVRRIARGQLELATELVRGDHGDDHGAAVHDARKALKRLRALVRLSRDAIGQERYQAENVTFRDVGRSLSSARDAEVMLQTLDELANRFAHEVPAGAWSRFRQVLEAEREATGAAQNGSAAAVDPFEPGRERLRTAVLRQPPSRNAARCVG
jgi:hypothetical protein